MLRKSIFGVFLTTMVSATGVPVMAQTNLSEFPLLKAVPSDAFITVAAKANPERKFLDDYWADVHVAFMESGIVHDVWEMFTDSLSEEKLDMIEELHERFYKLSMKVEWGKLFSKEMLYAGRFITPIRHGSPYEDLLLGRMDTDSAPVNYAALKALLAEFVKLVEANYGESVLTITETNKDGVTIATLAHRDLAGMVLSLATYKDVIAVSFGGPTLLNESMMLLQGAGKKKGLAQTERFKKAFDQLPPAEDTLVFFDPSLLMTRVGGMVKMMAGAEEMKEKPSVQKADDQPEEADAEAHEAKAAVAALTKFLEDVSLFDYVASVEYTDGYRVFSESVASLKVDAKNKPLYDVLAGGKNPDNFAKFIPQEAGNFYMSAGIDFKTLYAYIRDFVETQLPEGKPGFEEFERFQKEELEIDLENDIINNLEGPFITISMGNDWLLMFKVSDEKKISRALSALFKKINEHMGENNALMLSPVKVTGDRSFTQVSHPMMMMMGGMSPPVWGCAEGYLILGSSAKAVNLSLKTAAGDHADITKNKRWAAEAIRPKSANVDSISFTDEANFAQELQAGIGVASMVMGMTGMFGMQEAPPQARAFFQSIPGILAKLGPVAGKLDFYQSSASVTTFDGQRWLTKGVQNYKDPATRAKSESEEDDATPPRKATKKTPVETDEDADSEE